MDGSQHSYCTKYNEDSTPTYTNTTQPLSPLSPAEYLGSLPLSDHSNTSTHGASDSIPEDTTILAGPATTIHARLGLGYPSPPSTTSDPKHFVPLPGPSSTTATFETPSLPPATLESNRDITALVKRGSTSTNTDDYDSKHHDPPHGLPFRPIHFFGGLLDSPLVQQLIIRPGGEAAALGMASSRPSLALEDGERGSGGTIVDVDGGVSARVSAGSSPGSTTYRGMCEKDSLKDSTAEGGMRISRDTSSALLSPLSPEWESRALEHLPSPPSGSMSTCERSGLFGGGPAPSSSSHLDFCGGLSALGDNLGWGDEDQGDYDCDGTSPLGQVPPSSGSRSYHSSFDDLAGLTSSGPSAKPVLPLLDIPHPSFTSWRSYAPSPSSPLWVAESLSSTTSRAHTPRCPSPRGSQDSTSEDGSVATDGDEERYLVSPPSSGPPETPSPILPLLDGFLDETEESQHGSSDWNSLDDDETGLKTSWGPSSSLFAVEDGAAEHDQEWTRPFDDLMDFGPDDDSPYTLRSNTPLDTSYHHSPHQPFISLDPDPPPSQSPSSYSLHDEARLLQSPSSAFRAYSDLPDVSDDEEMEARPNDLARESSDRTGSSLLFGSQLPSPRHPGTEIQGELDLTSLDSTTLDSLPLPPLEKEEVKAFAALQRRAKEAEREAEEAEAASLSPEHQNTDLQDDAAERRQLAEKERAKAREAGVLVKLKLEEQGVWDLLAGQRHRDESVVGEADSVRRRTPRMANVAYHLLAKTLLNRHHQQSVTSPPLSSHPRLPSSPSPPLSHVSSPRPDSTTSTPSPAPKSSPPSKSYKYRPLWVRGLSLASLKNPASVALDAGLSGLGATPHQPFLPLQKRYKFLRSSPLARSSCLAASSTSAVSESTERSACAEDEDGDGGGFDALRRPLLWDASSGGEQSEGLLPAL